ncbi:NAD(P)H-dependent oxidoreductase [Paracoccus sp. Z330]|uniref:NAD(P)H-dependent oxidoreductase n=1 Tax=Paracoccus onchidii TaxID=3017813 RepID=A0ABT4ZCS2_9RHOB|nr:NADPH-dependent FMN reductase [Paracoccus onchidii]MDB6177156.1 NAD(P)H-dependent oxidoreductase [Paracoccus onchidii]
MTTILGLSGSLRRASFNTGLLRAAQETAPEGVRIDIGSIRDVPLYDGDLEEAEGIPAAVSQLTGALAQADGLLLATPEYNNGIPGVLKNALDWMSRGDGLSILRGKPVAIMGASPGSFGTTLAQTHWLPVIRTLNMRPYWEGRLMVPKAGDLCDGNGNLTDERTRKRVADFIAGFAGTI